MHMYPALNVLWGVLLSATVLVMVCRGTVTQHETDQLWLSDENDQSLNNREHDRLLKIVRLFRPLYLVLGVSTAVVSIIIAGAYVVQVWPYVHILPQH